jgi:thioredoxin 1
MLFLRFYIFNMSNLFTSKLYKYIFPVLFTGVLIFSWEKNYKMPWETSNPTHIVFIENSWDNALKEAKTQNKYIFVDAYASWCGPCKMLKATTFNDSKAAAL